MIKKMKFEKADKKAKSLLQRCNETISVIEETAKIYKVWSSSDFKHRGRTFYSDKFSLPFSNIPISVSHNLEDLIELVRLANLNDGNNEIFGSLFYYTMPLSHEQKLRIKEAQLVAVTVPHAREVRTSNRNLDSDLDRDPISLYNEEAREVLMSYSKADKLYGETVLKDYILFSIVNQLLDSSTFKREKLNVASPEMIRILKHSLANMQRLFQGLNPEEMIKDYAGLLEDIQKEIIALQPFFNEIKNNHRRYIYSFREMQGMFKVTKGIKDTRDDDDFIFFDAYKVRQEVLKHGNEVLPLLDKLSSGDIPWDSLLKDITDLIKFKHEEPIDKYPIVEYRNGSFSGIPYSKVSIDDIIGQENNVKRLGQLLYAFGEGKAIPHVALYGRPGRGKTMSLRALAGIHPNLRIILYSYKDVSNLREVVNTARKYPYQIVAYVDDMHFPSEFDFEQFKTTTSGVRSDWPQNLALVVSVNPESWDKYLPESMKNRFIKLDYTMNLDKAHWKKVFKVVARFEDYPPADEDIEKLWDGFFKGRRLTRQYLSNELNGRDIEKYIREQNALRGIEFPQSLK